MNGEIIRLVRFDLELIPDTHVPLSTSACCQVLDDGRLTDGKGRTVNFSNTVIIMTSNIGAQYLLEGLSGSISMAAAKEMVLTEVKKSFRCVANPACTLLYCTTVQCSAFQYSGLVTQGSCVYLNETFSCGSGPH